MIELRVCHVCKIQHYENCPECFGFGVYDKYERFPVSAAEAHDRQYRHGDVIRCRHCGSDERGCNFAEALK